MAGEQEISEILNQICVAGLDHTRSRARPLSPSQFDSSNCPNIHFDPRPLEDSERLRVFRER